MIYFDNAATSFPKPRPVLESVLEAVRFYGGNPGRSGHRISMRVSEKIFEVRQKTAAFFGAQPENVIFTLNCTMALNMAIKGALKQGGHAVTTVLEHNSVTRPLEALARDSGVTWSAAKVYEDDPDATVKEIEGLIRPDTRAVIATWASNVTGTVLPIRAIGQVCRKKKVLFIVDGAQAAGVFDIKLERDGIDVLCCAAHKGLYAAPGTGLLILGEGVKLSTLLEGGTGSDSISLVQPEFTPDRFESGTLNTVGVLSLGAGLDTVGKKGLKRIYDHEFGLCSRVYDAFRGTDGIGLLSGSFRYGEKAPIVSFTLDGMDSSAVCHELDRMGYALRGGMHCAGIAHRYLGTDKTGAVRFSPGIFNTRAETENFIRDVKKLRKIKPQG